MFATTLKGKVQCMFTPIYSLPVAKHALTSVNSLYSSAPHNCHSACSYSASCTADEIVHVLHVVPATEHAFVTCCGSGDTAQMHCCHPWAQSLLCVNSSENGTFLAAGGKLMS